MLEISTITFWHWLILGAALLTLEVLTSTAVLMWVGAGATFTALLTYLLPGISWQLQVLCFAVSTIAFLVMTRFWIHQKDISSEQPTLNRRAEGLVGQSHTLKEAIVGGHGQININDTIWQLQGPDAPVGATVKIVDVENNTLRVELAD